MPPDHGALVASWCASWCASWLGRARSFSGSVSRGWHREPRNSVTEPVLCPDRRLLFARVLWGLQGYALRLITPASSDARTLRSTAVSFSPICRRSNCSSAPHAMSSNMTSMFSWRGLLTAGSDMSRGNQTCAVSRQAMLRRCKTWALQSRVGNPIVGGQGSRATRKTVDTRTALSSQNTSRSCRDAPPQKIQQCLGWSSSIPEPVPTVEEHSTV